MHKYNDLCNFWIDLLNNIINWDEVRLQQVEFLKDLMNGFKVYKTTKKPKKELNYKAEDVYLLLLGNKNKTIGGIFLNTPRDKYNKEMYSQAWILFDLREKNFKKLFNKRIIENNFDQSDIVRQEYEESIAERTKLSKQILDENKKKRTEHKQWIV